MASNRPPVSIEARLQGTAHQLIHNFKSRIRPPTPSGKPVHTAGITNQIRGLNDVLFTIRVNSDLPNASQGAIAAVCYRKKSSGYVLRIYQRGTGSNTDRCWNVYDIPMQTQRRG